MHELKIEAIHKETDHAVTLVFEIPSSLKSEFSYQAGQFVTLGKSIGGEMVQRCYSLSTAPEIDSHFAITVKEVDGGKMSPTLVRGLNVGDVLQVSSPAGRFQLARNSTRHVFFAAGSGITPVYSMIKQSLHEKRDTFLIYSNRTQEDVIFNSSLSEMFSSHVERLVHVLSRPTRDWSGLKGRLDTDHLDALYPQLEHADAQYYMCGPDAYMTEIKEFLLNKGVSAEHIHFESFTVESTEIPAELEDALIVGDGDVSVGDQKIKVVLNGETTEIDCRADESVLDATVRHGMSVPYSCMDGVCFACMARLDGGKVAMPQDVALDEDEIMTDKCILTCQSRALNSSTVINYDEA